MEYGKLQFGRIRRFDESYRECFDQLRAGAIGEVRRHDMDTPRWFAQSAITDVYAVQFAGQSTKRNDATEVLSLDWMFADTL